MATKSLAARLFFAAALWTAIGILATALILLSLFRTSVERAIDDRLNASLETLIDRSLDLSTGEFIDPGPFGEARFDTPLSGWYWQITSKDPAVMPLVSRSLTFDGPLQFQNAPERLRGDTTAKSFYATTMQGEELRVLEQPITTAGGQRSYLVQIAGPTTFIENEIGRFRQALVIALAVLAVGLLTTTLVQVRYGLRPLDDIRAQLERIRTGDAENLEGRFPVEINPLVLELNALIDSNQKVIERARTHVGNLAHALKTPLSVITNEANSDRGPLADSVSHQAVVMRKQIDYYLDRARVAARVRIIGAATPVAPVVDRISRALLKIHHGKNVRLSTQIPETMRFRGEVQDLEEVLGNLLDNAFKWCSGEVRVSAVSNDAGEDAASRTLSIMIEDDGPGLPTEARPEVLKRGRRLDEQTPGSGLGLSIVVDLVELYEGSLTLDDSGLGGLKVSIDLPAA